MSDSASQTVFDMIVSGTDSTRFLKPSQTHFALPGDDEQLVQQSSTICINRRVEYSTRRELHVSLLRELSYSH